MGNKKLKFPGPGGSAAGGLGKALGIGTGVSVAITLVLACLSATLLDRQVLDVSRQGAMAVVVLLASSGVGAWVASRLAAHRKLLTCLLTGFLYLVVLLATTAFLFGGKYHGVPVTAAVVLGTSGAAGILGAGGGKHGRRVPKKYRIR